MAVGDNVIRALLERGRERRKGRKQEERLAQGSNLLNIIHGDASIEEKRKAALGLQSLGFPVSQDLLKPKVELGNLFEFLNVPKEIRESLTNLVDTDHSTAAQVLQFAAKLGGKPGELTLERIKELKGVGFFSEGKFKDSRFDRMSAEQIFAEKDFFATLKQELGVDLASGFLRGDKPVKPSAIQEKIQIFKDVTSTEDGGLISIEDLLNDEGKMGVLSAAGFSRKEILETFNVNPAAIVDAERSILNEIVVSNLFFQTAAPGLALPDFVAAYAAGREDEFVGADKTKKAGMEIVAKFYDRNGQLKDEVVFERAEKILQLAIDASVSVGDVVAKDLPLKFQPFMDAILKIEADTGVRITRSKVRRWMLEEKNLPGYNLTVDEESQFLEYFEE